MNKIVGNIFNFIGAIVSAIMSIVGFSIYSASSSFEASGVKFGSDFYTYIFEETEQVRAGTVGIENSINHGFGILLIFLGILFICYFGNKILKTFVKKEDANQPQPMLNNQQL